MLGRLAGEVEVVHRPDHAADGVEDDVEEDHGQRDPLAHDAEQHEHVRDHHGGEQLEEVLHPQVHDPEAPELGDREVVAGAGEQADGVEGRNRAARRRRTATACSPGARRPAAGAAAPQHHDPDARARASAVSARSARGRGTRSPAARTIRRRVLEHAVDAEVRADERAERRRPSARRAARRRACPGASARAAAIIGARKMPAATNEVATQKIASCTCQVRMRLYGKPLGEVEAEEVGDVGPVVLRRGTDERLDQEQRRHDEEEPGRGALRRRQRHVAGCAERERGALAPVPTEPRPSDRRRAKRIPMPPSSAISDSTLHTITFAVGSFADPRLGRPVVRVGVVVAGPVRRRGPGGPGEVRRQVRGGRPRVRDRLRLQPVLARRVGEEVAVVRHELAERLRLAALNARVLVVLVVAVAPEVLNRAPCGGVGPRAAVRVDRRCSTARRR